MGGSSADEKKQETSNSGPDVYIKENIKNIWKMLNINSEEFHHERKKIEKENKPLNINSKEFKN